jgi:hypothetical protein
LILPEKKVTLNGDCSVNELTLPAVCTVKEVSVTRGR